MAKITPLKTKTQTIQRPKDIMTTTTDTKRKPGNPNNTGFKKWLDERHSEQLNLQDIILVALEELQEPVSTQEMQYYLKREANIDIVDYRVKYALDQLVNARKATSHIETKTERELRANGTPITPKPAYLFNSGSTPRLRKTAVIVEGYSIFDPRTLAGKPKPRKAKANVVTATPAATTIAAPSNAAIDYLIEKLVADRTREIQAQLDEANKKLAQFRKLLS
jgi:hypothetical protein